MDDGMLFGSPEAVKWCLDLIEKLEPVSGLKLKWIKMSVLAPNAESANLCRHLLGSSIEVTENEMMNFVYLKTRTGTDSFVEKYLDVKLVQLENEIRSLSEMTHLHECFILLRSCASACKVTDLMRTIPPNNMKKFLAVFDLLLKKAMEKMIGHDLNSSCQLPVKM